MEDSEVKSRTSGPPTRDKKWVNEILIGVELTGQLLTVYLFFVYITYLYDHAIV